MSTNLIAAIFDVDGLLLDTEGVFDIAVQRYAQHMTGSKVGDVELLELRRKMLGRKKEESRQLLYDQLGILSEELKPKDDYLIWRGPILQELFPQTDLLPGAEDLLRKIHSDGIPMAIATSSNRDDLELKATKHPWLLNMFKKVVTGDQVAKGKPDPELFLLAAKGLGISLAECIVFEDATNGVEAALTGKSGLVVAVPDKRANLKAFEELRNANDSILLLKSLTEFDPVQYFGT